MSGVMTTPLAVLLELDTVRVVLLVLLGRVVTALALSAGQSDQSTHEFSFLPISRAGFTHTHEFVSRGLGLTKPPRKSTK